MTAAKQAAGQGLSASRNAKKNAARNARKRSAQARKERLRERLRALRNACEGLLVARGWRIVDAAEMAAWWVRDNWQSARRVMQKYGFDYETSSWGYVG